MKMINKKRFDKQLFVQCDCGEEIIEIGITPHPFEFIKEYFILFHGYYNRKKDKYASFYFKNIGKFRIFISTIYSHLSNKENDYSWFEDKYNSYKDKLPGNLKIQTNIFGDIEILKYANHKMLIKNKPTWCITINSINAQKLYEELKSWGI